MNLTGPQGYQGYQGKAGTNGTNGSRGAQGYQGYSGIPGGYVAGASLVSRGEIEFYSSGQAITDIYALLVDDNPGEIIISPEPGHSIRILISLVDGMNPIEFRVATHYTPATRPPMVLLNEYSGTAIIEAMNIGGTVYFGGANQSGM
jgi:hypothetical protein